MAYYGDTKLVRRADNEAGLKKYSKIWKIGEKPVYPGIYKCQHCSFEDVINRDCEKLPPCSNCKKKGHANEWKLLVRAIDPD
ncbi:TPA: hypothetical protein ACSP7Z_001735 [Serratia fonticola]